MARQRLRQGQAPVCQIAPADTHGKDSWGRRSRRGRRRQELIDKGDEGEGAGRGTRDRGHRGIRSNEMHESRGIGRGGEKNSKKVRKQSGNLGM